MSEILVIKRDGSEENFDVDKIADSIMQAAMSVGGENVELADELADNVFGDLESNGVDIITAEDLHNLVEKTLIENGHASTAKSYIITGNERNKLREMNSSLMKMYEEITFASADESDSKKENANIDSSTAMGTMLKYGSEGAKKFNLMNMMSSDIAEEHEGGDIHIHDLDFLSLTETCLQIPLDKLYEHGFNTGHGFLRAPAGIRSAAALAAIAIQSNQNDQHGGQSIPMFDYYLAPYVALTYLKNMAEVAKYRFELTTAERKELKGRLTALWSRKARVMDEKGIARVQEIVEEFLEEKEVRFTDKSIENILENVYEKTYDDTFQSMEAFIHNLNTMHSRAGAQVPFSSINYGTDTSVEGRMVMETLLLTTEDGLGNGETPIFPIQIIKVKEGVNYNPGDPNYDILKLGVRVSAKRLYPNFTNLDAPFNAALYVDGKPETEMATMGCRTRIGTNVHDKGKEIIPGRGNLSFTSINLPRLALESKGNIDVFFKKLDTKLELVHRQLLERFDIQCIKKPINYPFLMGQGCWIGSGQLGPNDDIREILKNGSLAVGFIGLAETLIALVGKHHGESEEAQELGLKIVQRMRDYTDAWSKEEMMNYSVIGTPAEGLSGRFVRMDKKKFGIIPGVTDKDYYTNSSHVPVYYKISASRKVDIETPYHEIENGGHILYIEVDGDPSLNLKAFMKIIRYMHDAGAGYFALNHPVDMDPVCNYVGVIGDTCPRCGRKEGEPMTMEMWNKIHKYAGAANAGTCGACGAEVEEKDRITNEIDI
jgi:ribonucleoside-triphosphate reductase (formate)